MTDKELYLYQERQIKKLLQPYKFNFNEAKIEELAKQYITLNERILHKQQSLNHSMMLYR